MLDMDDNYDQVSTEEDDYDSGEEEEIVEEEEEDVDDVQWRQPLEQKVEALKTDLINSNKRCNEFYQKVISLQTEMKMVTDLSTAHAEMTTGNDVVNGIAHFPPEIWGIILDQLEDSKALQTCHDTCKLWRVLLLKQKKTTFLFKDIFKFIAPFLDLTTALNCRLVSKMWKGNVDKYYNSLTPSEFGDVFRTSLVWFAEPGSYSMESTPPSTILGSSYHFRSHDDLQHFVHKFDNTEGKNILNPFITDFVYFSDCQESLDGVVQMWGYIVKTFLPKFGKFIRRCNIEFCLRFNLTQEMVHLITLATVSRMPNISALAIDYMRDDKNVVFSHLRLHGFKAACGFHEDSDLSNYYIDLQTLTELHIPILGFSTVKSLLKNHLLHLTIDFDRSAYLIENVTRTISFPKLKILKTKATTVNLFIMKNWSHDNLEKLILHSESFIELLRFLKRFKNTIVELELFLSIEDEEAMFLRLDLSKLKILRIQVDKTIANLDFILSLSLLECLEIDLVGSEPDENTVQQSSAHESFKSVVQILELVGWYDRLASSNIWLFFPRLTRVNIVTNCSNISWHYVRKANGCIENFTHVRPKIDMSQLDNLL